MAASLHDRLQPSWLLVEPRSSELARRFYDRLFELDPALRALFAKTDFQEQHRKFVMSIEAIVEHAAEPERLLPYAAQLGRRHVSYGTLDHHYETVGNALIWALDEIAGERMSVDDRAAWHEAFALVSSVMRRAAMMTTGEITAAMRPAEAAPPTA
jgi:hemoglobin-like flavoprotein